MSEELHMAMSPIELISHASVTRGSLAAWPGASAGAPARALAWRLAAEAVKLSTTEDDVVEHGRRK